MMNETLAKYLDKIEVKTVELTYEGQERKWISLSNTKRIRWK
jgi:hypothetical protein